MKDRVNELYEYLRQFMIESNWEDEYVPKQARAIFSTICLIGNIIADTYIADIYMYDLYTLSNVDEFMEFDEFENFMYEYIV